MVEQERRKGYSRPRQPAVGGARPLLDGAAMMRSVAIISGLLTLVGLICGAYITGRSQTRIDSAEDKVETLKRIQNADVGEGDPDADRDWLDEFLDRMSKGQ